MMNTALHYLDDTYVDTGDASVSGAGRDDRGPFLVLDQTIFYPQGGGQPTDTGSIRAGEADLPVAFVGFDDGAVRHYLAEEPADLDALVGRRCALRVDRSRRLAHARLHTAGHLISGIIDAQDGPLHAVKGFHFPDGPYVEFAGKSDAEPDSFLAAVQVQIDSLLAEDPPITAETLDYDELQERCRHIPPHLPKDKPLRVVTIAGLEPVPCGGTHVARLAELGSVTVVKMKSKKGNTKISYRVDAHG